MKSMSVFLGLAAVLLLLPMVPSFVLSLLKMRNEAANVNLAFWKKFGLGEVGGLVGAIASIAALYSAEPQWCADMSAKGSYCDGQGGLILIFTLPVATVVGVIVAMLWSWSSLRISANSPWTSVFSYRGENRAKNVGIAIAIQIAYWAIFFLAFRAFSLSLLEG